MVFQPAGSKMIWESSEAYHAERKAFEKRLRAQQKLTEAQIQERWHARVFNPPSISSGKPRSPAPKKFEYESHLKELKKAVKAFPKGLPRVHSPGLTIQKLKGKPGRKPLH